MTLRILPGGAAATVLPTVPASALTIDALHADGLVSFDDGTDPWADPELAAALDHVRRAPHRVVCRACEHVVKTVDGEGDCPSCAAEMRLAADEAHAGYVAHLDAASPWGPSWDLADAFGAVA